MKLGELRERMARMVLPGQDELFLQHQEGGAYLLVLRRTLPKGFTVSAEEIIRPAGLSVPELVSKIRELVGAVAQREFDYRNQRNSVDLLMWETELDYRERIIDAS